MTEYISVVNKWLPQLLYLSIRLSMFKITSKAANKKVTHLIQSFQPDDKNRFLADCGMLRWKTHQIFF